MNKAILMGRLTKEPELRATSNGVSVCTFTLAIERKFKDKSGNRLTDFIPCVTWRQQADFVSRYFSKGQRVAVIGSIQPRSYEDQSGQKRYITEVIVEEIYFADGKRDVNDDYQRQEEDLYYETSDDPTSLPFDM